MKPILRPAWEFLSGAAESPTFDKFQDAFAAALAPFDFDRFSCAFGKGRRGDRTPPHALFGRSYEAWDTYYLARGYLNRDPCIRKLFVDPAPFAWSDMPLSRLSPIARQIRLEAAEAGARNGFVVPVCGADGELYGVRLTSPQKKLHPDIRPTLHALSVVYTVLGIRHTQGRTCDSAPRSPLSRREVECLGWASEGKSDWDISEILHIAESTVHEHIERAKAKLGVRSRIQAAVISAMKGWLPVNPSI